MACIRLFKGGRGRGRVTSSIGFVQEGITLELINSWNRVKEGPEPIVVINGKAKANPTVEEVVAEYDHSRDPSGGTR